jgi:hypothetical protein
MPSTDRISRRHALALLGSGLLTGCLNQTDSGTADTPTVQSPDETTPLSADTASASPTGPQLRQTSRLPIRHSNPETQPGPHPLYQRTGRGRYPDTMPAAHGEHPRVMVRPRFRWTGTGNRPSAGRTSVCLLRTLMVSSSPSRRPMGPAQPSPGSSPEVARWSGTARSNRVWSLDQHSTALTCTSRWAQARSLRTRHVVLDMCFGDRISAISDVDCESGGEWRETADPQYRTPLPG